MTVQPDLCPTCSETTFNLLVFPRGGSFAGKEHMHKILDEFEISQDQKKKFSHFLFAANQIPLKPLFPQVSDCCSLGDFY